jgi:hypothetical protein
MRISPYVLTAALVTLTLSATISRAQEPVSPATAAPAPAALDAAAPDPTHSKIRIVRLSEVKGEVQVDRLGGKGFEFAMANLPVVEGEKLKTGNGVAEIEFEDNSTVRVAQDSTVEFPRLEMLPGGAKASTLTVLKGTVYVSLINTKGNEFVVNAGQQKINLPPDSHVRLQLAGNQADLAVLHGEAQVEQASGTTTVEKKRTLTFNLDGQSQPVMAKNVTEAPLDDWDKTSVQYHKTVANVSSFGNSPYAYGLNDLNYYGSFGNFGGCGSMWRPYFAGAAWDPYASGAWAYYPTAGYSWVSPYPWGWTPYHYGSWAYCSGVGWGWQPGGSWLGLNNTAFLAKPAGGPSGILNHPHPPSHPPMPAQSSLTLVNMKSIPTSALNKGETFVFRQDSAGLGVPRATLGKLNGFSQTTATHGVASTPVYFGGARSESGGEHGAYNPSAGYSASAPSSSHSYSGGVQSGGSSAGGMSGGHSGGGGGMGGGASAGGGGGRH